MADSDKVLGVSIDGRTKTRTFGGYRIDYADTRSIVEIGRATGDIPEDEDDYFTSAAKNPPAGYPGHEAKSGYDRKVVTKYEEDSTGSRVATTRDEVTAILDNAGVTYKTEDVAPTQSERDVAAQWGADNGLDMVSAMDWNQAVEDLAAGNITQEDFNRGKNPHQGGTFDIPNKPSKPGNS